MTGYSNSLITFLKNYSEPAFRTIPGIAASEGSLPTANHLMRGKTILKLQLRMMSISKGKLGMCVEEGGICLNLTISNPKFVYLELT